MRRTLTYAALGIYSPVSLYTLYRTYRRVDVGIAVASGIGVDVAFRQWYCVVNISLSSTSLPTVAPFSMTDIDSGGTFDEIINIFLAIIGPFGTALCAHVPVVANGKIIGVTSWASQDSFPPGTKATYACDDGHYFSPQIAKWSIECMACGQWSSIPEACQGNQTFYDQSRTYNFNFFVVLIKTFVSTGYT